MAVSFYDFISLVKKFPGLICESSQAQMEQYCRVVVELCKVLSLHRSFEVKKKKKQRESLLYILLLSVYCM